MIRAVLDTNVLISALLFSREVGQIAENWKKGLVAPIFSKATFDESRRVLTYHKFSLTDHEIKTLIEDELLPFCEVFETEEEIEGICRDHADDKFLSVAVAAGAEYLVSGDGDLLQLGNFCNIPIVTTTAFLKIISGDSILNSNRGSGI